MDVLQAMRDERRGTGVTGEHYQSILTLHRVRRIDPDSEPDEVIDEGEIDMGDRGGLPTGYEDTTLHT